MGHHRSAYKTTVLLASGTEIIEFDVRCIVLLALGFQRSKNERPNERPAHFSVACNHR